MSDPAEPVREDAKARRRGGMITLIAVAFALACVASFLLVAVGFGRQG